MSTATTASTPTASCAPASSSPAADRTESDAAGPGRPGQNRRDVFDQLEAAVEGAAADHVERYVGIAVVDPFPAGVPGDDGKDNHPEPVDQAGRQQRAAQTEAAHGAHGLGGLLLH